MEPESLDYFRSPKDGDESPACLDPSRALELDLRQFPSAPASPWEYHRFFERALTAARLRQANRVWIRIARDDDELRRMLERWRFVQFDDSLAKLLFVRGITAPTATSGGKIEKVDPPLDTDDEILEVVRQFESCTLPFEHWTHRAHVAVALVYLRKFSFDEALNRLRRHIQLYNQLRGDPNGYDEELTKHYLHQIDSQKSPATPLQVDFQTVGWAKRSAGPPSIPPSPPNNQKQSSR